MIDDCSNYHVATRVKLLLDIRVQFIFFITQVTLLTRLGLVPFQRVIWATLGLVA